MATGRSKDIPYIPSVPPENPDELRWWMHNEFIMIQQALEALRITSSSRNFPKWDDEKFPVNSLSVRPNQTTPSTTFVHNTKMAVFEDGYSSTAALCFICQIPHAYQYDASIGPHLHTCNIAGLTGKVRWAMTYEWQNNYDVLGVSATTVYVTQTLEGTADKIDIVGFPKIDGTNKTLSSIITGNVWRNSGDASDTAAGSIALIEFDIHVPRDSDGSRQEYIK